MKSTKANNTRTSPFGPQTHRNSCEKQSNTLLLMITAEDLLHAKTKYHRRNRHPELQWSSNHSQTEICRHISQPLSSSFLLLLPPVLLTKKSNQKRNKNSDQILLFIPKKHNNPKKIHRLGIYGQDFSTPESDKR